ncbi:hypothetical protein D0859_00428 [Hortaea werneckii]|uniref:Uncharacterized protein n=1 Tax=Hortaea werneckii TaxID=91943 RepID=A0A3M7JCK2_HORWE|nr:hypothetical protein D0859_00428 [Hortaea werneckii]
MERLQMIQEFNTASLSCFQGLRTRTASDLNMSREQYVPPTLTQDNAQQGGASSTGVGGFNITGANTFEDNRPVNYLCGDCDAKVVLRKSEAIRCKECGYRVLYKERTNR